MKFLLFSYLFSAFPYRALVFDMSAHILASDWKPWAWLVNSVGFQCERGRYVVRVVTEDWPRIARWPLDTGVPFPNEDRFPIRDSSGNCPLANLRLFTMNVVFQKSETPCNKIMFTTLAHVSTNMHLLFTFPVTYWKFAPIRPPLNTSCPSFCPVSFSYYSMSLSPLY